MCGLPLRDGRPTVATIQMSLDSDDPIKPFMGCMFHVECVDRHPLGRQILDESEDYRRAGLNRLCAVCGEVTSRVDALWTGRLGPARTRAGRFNYVKLHRKCVSKYPRIGELMRHVDMILADGSTQHTTAGSLRRTLLKIQSE